MNKFELELELIQYLLVRIDESGRTNREVHMTCHEIMPKRHHKPLAQENNAAPCDSCLSIVGYEPKSCGARSLISVHGGDGPRKGGIQRTTDDRG